MVPVVTKLADIRLRDESDAAKRVARWQRIALEAAKQSGRAVVPEVSSPVAFESLLARRRVPELASDVFRTRWPIIERSRQLACQNRLRRGRPDR